MSPIAVGVISIVGAHAVAEPSAPFVKLSGNDLQVNGQTTVMELFLVLVMHNTSAVAD